MLAGSVLVVDDEEEMLSLLRTDLELRGFSVRTASSGAAAFDLLRHEAIDVVLTDIAMPGVDGIELCTRIATHNPDVPVVVMTAFGSMETAVDALRAGAFDFVAKPMDHELRYHLEFPVGIPTSRTIWGWERATCSRKKYASFCCTSYAHISQFLLFTTREYDTMHKLKVVMPV